MILLGHHNLKPKCFLTLKIMTKQRNRDNNFKMQIKLGWNLTELLIDKPS
jgi:hypothetical protein